MMAWKPHASQSLEEASLAAPGAAVEPVKLIPTNDAVYAEVCRARNGANLYVSTNAVNDTMAAVRRLSAQLADKTDPGAYLVEGHRDGEGDLIGTEIFLNKAQALKVARYYRNGSQREHQGTVTELFRSVTPIAQQSTASGAVPVKAWEQRRSESTEEVNDMPIGRENFMLREIADLRAALAAAPLPQVQPSEALEALATITLGGIEGDELGDIDIEIIDKARVEALQYQMVRTDAPVFVTLYAKAQPSVAQAVAAVPVPKDAKLWADGIWRDSSGNTLGPDASNGAQAVADTTGEVKS